MAEFSRQPLNLGLVFHVICIFCLHHALGKIHSWKLFALGKIFAHGRIKSGGKYLLKKNKKPKKKKGPKEKERKRIICQEKEKILCESNWYWRSSMLASRFRTKESPSNQKLLYIKLKRRFPFIFTSTSHDTKSSTIASNRNFDCRFVVLLLSIFSVFSILPRGFPLPLATLPIIVSSFSTLH